MIVTGDMPGLESIAREVANAAFGCAGQRCTATRRVIVLDSIHNAFLECLMRFTAALARGAPEAEATRVGPLPPEF